MPPPAVLVKHHKDVEVQLSSLALDIARKEGWNGSLKPRKRFTNAYLIKNNDDVLLGLKKRGFGAGKVNGFGGKVDASETIYDAALREMKEESGLSLTNMVCVGVLLYDYPLKDSAMEVYVYKATEYEGEPVETDEMIPRWTKRRDLEFSTMWADDPYWIHKLYEAEDSGDARDAEVNPRLFVGWFNFSEDMSQVVRCGVEDVKL